jgi:hypothetical protein
VRQSGIQVRAGEEKTVTIILERKPPPIETIVELPAPERLPLSIGRRVGQDIEGNDLQFFDLQQDVTGTSRDLSAVVPPTDGRAGYAISAEGLPPAYSRLYVDGIEENLLRHPGLPGEPATAPLFSRNALTSVAALENGFDLEWGGASASLLTAQSRSGSNRLAFNPYLTYAGSSLGGKGADNPGDSSTTSLQAGAVLSGALVRDTAQFVLGFNYQTLEAPGGNPWQQDSAAFGGSPVSLRVALPAIATDSFSSNVGPFTRPAVRSFRGGNVFGRVDWRLSRVMGLFARFGFAKWKEQNPQVDQVLVSGLGTRLESRDISGAVGITSAWSRTANELRLGLRLSRRDWIADDLPSTQLVGEGAAIGISPVVPGKFDQRAVNISNTVQYALSSHHLKAGVAAEFGKWKENYAFGRQGIYQFGDLDDFANGVGTFFQVLAPGSVDISTLDFAAFAQDVWAVSRSFQLEGGLRYQIRSLPSDEIKRNDPWVNASGVTYTTHPSDHNNIAPRLAFVWDVQNRSDWVLRGGGGYYYTPMDPALFSEAVIYDGGALVRRGQGAFSTWPTVPDSLAAPIMGPRLTLFNSGYQDPRTAKWDLSLSHGLPGRISIELAGAYHHTDYLPRRTDLNRLPSPTGTTQEGRPVFGTLVQQGGMLSAAPGSNRRFSGFDLVSGVVPTGFADYYGVTLVVERRAVRGLELRAAYTYSRTNDNTLLGPSGDPADQLSPFPQDPVSDEWVDGRSDLDIPHRVVLTGDYHLGGSRGIEFGVRYRFRSGLPFTPGFRSGVDVNADGSGENDPAFLDNSVPGVPKLISAHDCLSSQVGDFAGRNSCRQKGAHALDLRFAVRLPVRVMGGDLRLLVDAFNVVSTETGIVDRAVFLVDPSQSITTNGSGNVTIPYVANPHFGSLLSRRGEPRLVRFGLKVDY